MTTNIRTQIVKRDVDAIVARLAEFEGKVKSKTFVVSGGAGFIGSWFCEVAIALGANVICVDNLIASTEENITELEKSSKFTFIKSKVENADIPSGADYVVHMASIASPPLYQRNPIETLNSGVLGTIKLLDYAKANNVLSFLLTSTSEVYGNPPSDKIPTDETYPGFVYSYGSRSMYDESKRVAEAYCYAYRNFVPFRIVRIFNTYGPKIDAGSPSQYGRALIKFVKQAINNDPITAYGNGDTTRSFCYISDQIVGLYKLLLTDNIDGEVVNIGNDKEISILSLAEKIKLVSRSNSSIVLNAEPSYNLANDPKRRCPNIEKAGALLGFTPDVSLEEGLRKTIEWTKATQ